MALEFAHGAIQLTTGAIGTTFTVSGLPFQPKALRFYWNGVDSATDAASETVFGRSGIGFAVSPTERRAVGDVDHDATSTAVCASVAVDHAVVVTLDGATNAINGLVDLDAINSDGFDLIVDDVLPEPMTLFWEAWGGSDITVAAVGDIAEPAATGNVDYTVTGFVGADTDQVVMFAGCQSTGSLNTGAGTDAGICVGFASSGDAADQCVVVNNNDDGSTTLDTDGYGRGGECLAKIAVGGGSVNSRAQLTQFGTDNFRLNWISRTLTNRRNIFMAVKGGSWKAGGYTIDGNTGSDTATVSGLAFAPKGVSLIGRMATEQAAGTSATVGILGLGSGSSTSSRRSLGFNSENATANTEINVCVEYDQVLSFPSTAGALQAAYDINAMNSDGFEIIVDTAGGVASEWQGYLAFGDAAASGPTTIEGSGTSQGAATAAATSGATKGSSATSTGAATVSGAGAAIKPANATSAGAATVSATGAGVLQTVGTASGVGAAAATAARVVPGSSAASGAAAAIAAGSSTAQASGACAGAASVAGAGVAVVTAAAAAGAGAATAASTGAAVATASASSAGAGTATAEGEAVAGGGDPVVVGGSGTSAGTGSAAATGATLATASASATGTATAAAATAALATTSATASGVGSAVAEGEAVDAGAPVVMEASGTSAGTSAASATSGATKSASGMALGVGTAQASGADAAAPAVLPSTGGATRRQHLRFRRNGEVVLLNRPSRFAGAGQVTFSAGAQATLSTKAMRSSTGRAAPEGAAEVVVKPGSVIRKIARPQIRGDGAAAVLLRARPARVWMRVGQVTPVGFDNPSERELMVLALDLSRKRRQRRRQRILEALRVHA